VVPCPDAVRLEESGTVTSDNLGDLPEDYTRAAERIAAARCLVRSDLAGRAVELLASLLALPSSSPLHSYARLVGGEAALRHGDPTSALTHLTGLKFPEGPAARRLQNLSGEALVLSGQSAAGRHQLEAFLKGSWGVAGKKAEPNGGNPIEARWWLTVAARKDEDPAAETRLLQRLWTQHPESPREEEVLKRLEALSGPFPDGTNEEHATLQGERIATLESTYHWDKALALRDSLQSAPNEGERARAAFARAVFKARDYPRALTLYEALKNPGPGELFNHAVVATRTGDYPRATALYKKLHAAADDESARPRSKLVDQASYKIGYLAYDSGQFDTAITELRAHLARHPRSRYAESSRWFIAWSLIKLERLDAAKGALSRLKQNHPKSSLVAAVDYWRARIAGMQGDPETQRKGLTSVLEDHPVSSYAWFAARALGRTWPSQQAPAPSLLPAVEELAAVRRGRALAAAGLDSWGRAELRSLRALLGKGKPEVVQAYAEALSATGAWAEARKLVLSRCKPALTASDDPLLARLCWPRPLVDVASKAARDGGVSPHLPFAIMRAETGWKPWLTSPAGASGLMQVMPSLGESLTKELHPDRHWDPLDLYDPSINAELGVAELVSLHKRFDGTGVSPRTPLVIAGYNGGEKAVRRWLGLYDSPPPADVFAEDVGYTETRRYVRKVLATLMAYRYVYGDEPPAAP
jgi:soluble lytic murein transglycosylase